MFWPRDKTKGLDLCRVAAVPRILCVRGKDVDDTRDKRKGDDRLGMCKEKRKVVGFYVMLMSAEVGGVRRPPWQGRGRLGSGSRQIAPGVHPDQALLLGQPRSPGCFSLDRLRGRTLGSESWNLPPAARSPLAADCPVCPPLRLVDSPDVESATPWAKFAGAAGYLNPWGDARVGDGNGRTRSPTALPDGQHTMRFLVDLPLGSLAQSPLADRSACEYESFAVGRRHWNPSGLGSLETGDWRLATGDTRHGNADLGATCSSELDVASGPAG